MLVVDASVVTRWFVPNLAWPSADSVLDEGEQLAAPDLVIAEVANAFWKAIKAEYMTVDEMQIALQNLPGFFSDLVPLQMLINEAGALAVTLDHPVYDCCYIAHAARERAPLVTADKRLAETARQTTGIEVRLIA